MEPENIWKITCLKRKIIFQTSIILFHLNFPGYTWIWFSCPTGSSILWRLSKIWWAPRRRWNYHALFLLEPHQQLNTQFAICNKNGTYVCKIRYFITYEDRWHRVWLMRIGSWPVDLVSVTGWSTVAVWWALRNRTWFKKRNRWVRTFNSIVSLGHVLGFRIVFVLLGSLLQTFGKKPSWSASPTSSTFRKWLWGGRGGLSDTLDTHCWQPRMPLANKGTSGSN